MRGEYTIRDQGTTRVLAFGDREYETPYSSAVIEAIIARKGLSRAPQYLTHRASRTWYLEPLFAHLHATGVRNLRVLEVGCSAGHITEYLNEQPCIGEIAAYDVDKSLVEITRMKRDELGLTKVSRIDHLSNEESMDLPYKEGSFDLIIVLAVVEHLPFENRYLYVDSYYRSLKVGGMIGFFDTPNRYFPFETHSIGLPFIHSLPPQIAFLYAKLFRKLGGVDFSSFVRAGTGWRNASYYECLPKTLMIDVKDISARLSQIRLK